ncbi:Tim10/DDP family zinc finger-domain-containing protein [Schizophyllum amplum]|uniref:Mitochondrial import inner membrane translocase subunit n=1 Tax=Schizophyllum amplum TaxID=97359 RepID=A0A550CE07_9AGAR|nr:Tim10/DDP family zinc finger-domain-containing protein [Auriculariopsis ampla]
MASLFGGSSSSSGDMLARKEQVMKSVRSELALANAQELMNSANKACFAKCVTKPGSSLGGSEEVCLERCLGRYMDAFNIVASTYITRLKRDRQEHAATGLATGAGEFVSA